MSFLPGMSGIAGMMSSRSYVPPTFIGAATYTRTTGTAAANYHASTQNGDLVVLARCSDLNGGAWNVPSGFVDFVADGASASPDYQAARKIISGGETSCSLTTGGMSSGIVLLTFRGVDQTTPIDAVAAAVSTGSPGNPDPPSVTTVTPNAMVVALGFLDDDIVASITEPSGYTNGTFAVGSGTDGTQGCSTMAATLVKAVPGAEDPGAFSSAKDDAWVGFTFAIRPI